MKEDCNHEMVHLTTIKDELDPNIEIKVCHCHCGHIEAMMIKDDREVNIPLTPYTKQALSEVRSLVKRLS